LYDPNCKPLSFIQITDTHIDNDDASTWTDLNLAVSVINSIHPDFVLVTGDLVDWACDNNFQRFKSVMENVDETIPKYYIVGNHDIRDNPPPDFLSHSYNSYINNIDSQYDEIIIDNYFNEYGIVLFGFDSNDKGTILKGTILNDYSGEISDDQLSWLSGKLNDYNGAHQIIVYMHHPVFARTDDYDDYSGEDPVISDDMDNRDAFIDLCQANDENGFDRVSLVLTGHTHSNGVWEENGKYESHYFIQGRDLISFDDGYYNNFVSKSTKYIHTTSATEGKEGYGNGYRLIQLCGENAVYRAYNLYDEDISPNILPSVSNVVINPENPTDTDAVTVYADIDGGAVYGDDIGAKNVICYWSTDQTHWTELEMIPYSGVTYKTVSDIPIQSEGTTIYYKVMAENNDGYIGLSNVRSYTVGSSCGTMGVSPTLWSPTITDGSSDSESIIVSASDGIVKGVTVSKISGPSWLTPSTTSLGDISSDSTKAFTITASPPAAISGDYPYVLRIINICGNPSSIDVTGVIHIPEEPILAYSPSSHDFGDMLEGQTDSTTFEIWNSGTGTLTYSLSESLEFRNGNTDILIK